MIIKLPDGYNKHFSLFHDEPLAYDGDLVKLRCADEGKEYMFAWKHKDSLRKAIEAELPSNEFFAWLKAEGK